MPLDQGSPVTWVLLQNLGVGVLSYINVMYDIIEAHVFSNAKESGC